MLKQTLIKGWGGGLKAGMNKQIIKKIGPNFTKRPWHGYHVPHTYKIVQQWMSNGSFNKCMLNNESILKVSCWYYEYSKTLPIFFKKTCSLKKLKFENFEIFTNNIINVKIAKVFEYVCFEELGEILNPLALKLGPIFWIANSSGWWFKLYDAHWFWVQKKPILDPCEVVLKLDSRPISSFNF